MVRPCVRSASGLEARCVGPGERLYIPMPFFWTGGFGQGLLTVLVAGATLLTEAEPDPAQRSSSCSGSGRRCSVAGRTRRLGWPPNQASPTADLSCLRDGSLAAVLPPERRPAPGARANLFGMTETSVPTAGTGWTGICRRTSSAAAAGPSRASKSASSTRTRARRSSPASRARSGCAATTSFVASAADSDRRRLHPRTARIATGDLGRLDADGYLWYSGRLDDMVKVKGATVYPIRGGGGPALPSGEVSQAFVTDVSDDGAVARSARWSITDALASKRCTPRSERGSARSRCRRVGSSRRTPMPSR